VFTKLIERNTTIPTKKSEIFSTAADNQTTVEIHVLQGERPMAIDNKTIGRFHLDGLPPAPRGLPQIEVAFDIDANGILNVSALDKATGRQQSIKIQASSGLTEQEIQKMVKDAQAHESDDKARKEKIDAINGGDSLAYQTEKNLKDLADKLDADQKVRVQAAVDRLKDAVKRESVDDIKSAGDALNAIWHEVSAKLYSQASPHNGGSATGSDDGNAGGTTHSQAEPKDAKGPDNVVDADYKVVD
jgi:molecular chaperone DnaK